MRRSNRKSHTEASSNEPVQPLLTMADVCTLLCLSRPMIYTLINQGLPVIKFGRSVRFSPTSLHRWLAMREESGCHMARRMFNEGSVFQRKDGRYVASVRLENGKKKQRYFKTEKEAQGSSARCCTSKARYRLALPKHSRRISSNGLSRYRSSQRFVSVPLICIGL